MSATAETLMLYTEILQREARGPGDYENAMRRIEAKYGLKFWTQWGLRNRKPQDLRSSLISKVRDVYLSVLETSVRRDLMKLQNEVLKGGQDASLAGLEAEAREILERIRQAQSALS